MRMRNVNPLHILCAGIMLILGLPASARAETIPCDTDTTKNFMTIDASIVGACLDAGFDNPSLTGNPDNDVFLTAAGAAYTSIGTTTFTQSGSTGTFYFASSLWETYGQIAVGFKFGTGNQPDNWFVYSLNSDLTSGDWSWTFNNVKGQGGGLSGVRLYGVEGSGTPTPDPVTSLSEPGSLALLLLGLVTVGAVSRKFAPAG